MPWGLKRYYGAGQRRFYDFNVWTDQKRIEKLTIGTC
jgi:hypothetical protein